MRDLVHKPRSLRREFLHGEASGGIVLLAAALVVPPPFGWFGILPAIGIFEETGFKPAGLVNALSYVAWSLWLIALGVHIVFW
jgi:hypothetical protein